MVINEVLFNPPGTDTPNQYIEFRGTPNSVITPGTYFVAVDGEKAGNPGRIENVFDLSGVPVGGNGFLVLLQKGGPYRPSANSTILENAGSGAGWGSGSSSTIRHTGRNGATALGHASLTFFLIQTANPPYPGDDIDKDDDGTPDGAIFAGWTVLDSLGVLDADGLGDCVYALVNFRRSTPPGNTAKALGVIVPIAFTPSYAGRCSNSNGATATNWVASDNLGGSVPAWELGSAATTYPSSLSNAPLNHIGDPNFGAPAIPGVVVSVSAVPLAVTEGGSAQPFNLALTAAPSGKVTLEISSGPPLGLSADGGLSFTNNVFVALSNTAPMSVLVRATADSVLGTMPRFATVTNSVAASEDALRYPVSSLIPDVQVSIVENGFLVINEVKANPPGTNDVPWEFIELRGSPGLVLSNVQLLVINGSASSDPGRVVSSFNLAGFPVGTNGLVLVAPTNLPYAPVLGTTTILDSRFNTPGGLLGNGTISLTLVGSASAIAEGQDLDKGDNGVLEGLPGDAVVLDAVGFWTGASSDIVYGGVALQLPGASPDAATRFPGDTRPLKASAWFYGSLSGPNPDSLRYSDSGVSANFPPGAVLSPGEWNRLPPLFAAVTPVSGVIGDPANPVARFEITNWFSLSGSPTIWAASTNPAVIANSNILTSIKATGSGTLTLIPVGVGYSEITIYAADGVMTGRVSFAYAASAPGREGGIWHLGASDGSTALAVDHDFMVMGDDENQTLRLYPRNYSEVAISTYDMTPFLGLPDVQSGLPREVDVEASTRVGNRFFWMGSLGHSTAGESRTNRTRVFTTDLVAVGAASTLSYAGRYDFLKLDLINWDKLNLHGKGTNYYGFEASDAAGVSPKEPDGSGFAVEGLSMLPGNSNVAYVGFRAPIVPPTNRTYALLVPVLNFATLAAGNAPAGSAQFGSPVELDLYGRGIRSIEAGTNGFLIIGGPPGAGTGQYPQDFRLYSWSGIPGDNPQQRAGDLNGLNPEGIVEIPFQPWTATNRVQIVSDQGSVEFYGDGVPAKRLTVPNFRKSRTDWVELGNVTKPVPIITACEILSSTVRLKWRSLSNEVYSVQVSADKQLELWTNAPGDVVAQGPFAQKELPRTAASGFYRVIAQP